MPELIVMVEEESMRALLDPILPGLLPDGWTPRIIPHQGKSDLERSIPRKLRAWRDPGARFIVMRDNDRGDCAVRKEALLAHVAGTGREAQTKVRIVCQELEAWVIGDLGAVEAALGVASHALRRMAQEPDAVPHPVHLLERHYGSYAKRSDAARVAQHMVPENNTSESFQAFVSAVRTLTSQG